MEKFFKPGRIYEPNDDRRSRVLANFAKWERAVSRFGGWYDDQEREETLRGTTPAGAKADERGDQRSLG